MVKIVIVHIGRKATPTFRYIILNRAGVGTSLAELHRNF